jgi:hypothetical protein
LGSHSRQYPTWRTIMPWWLEIYLWGMIPAWPIASLAWIRIMHRDEEADNEVIGLGIMMGATMAMVWPLFIPAYWIWEWLRHMLKADK